MPSYPKPRYLFGGDRTIIVEFGNEISEQVNLMVRRFTQAVENARISGVIELVPTYCSVAVYYNPLEVPGLKLLERLRSLEMNLGDTVVMPTRTVLVPTVYGGEYGPDLPDVARYAGLTPEEVIAIHSGVLYTVYMLGFTPGFAYLGGMSPRIASPRLSNPREKIPGGSVGIAGNQTGIYPIDSPGGWRLIGRTPLKLFDPNRNPPVLFQAGDKVRFIPIGEEEYWRLKKAVELGEYVAEIIEGADDKVGDGYGH